MQTFDSILTQAKLGGVVTNQLTVSMLKEVAVPRLYQEGFRNWDGTMLLLPLWALAHMAPGSRLKCIDGSYATVGVDTIDNDTRGGCIAFGIERNDIPVKE